MKRSTFCHLGFALAAAVAAAFSAIADGEVYYYWKGANNGFVDTAENWLDAEGNPVEAAPENGPSSKAVLVFTNFTGTVKCNSAYKYYGYILCDGCGDVTIGNSKEIHLLGGPISNETANSKLTLGYTTKLAAPTNVIDVVNKGASIYVRNGLNDGVSRVLVKRGNGTFRTPDAAGSAVNDVKEVVMQSGRWEIASPDVKTFLVTCTLTFDGNDPTALVCRQKNGSAVITTLTFSGGCIRETESVDNTEHGFTDNGDGYPLALVGNIGDSYFSGKIYGTMSFLWGPNAANSSRTFTFAKATHPTSGDFTVTNGIVRLIDGVSFPNLGTVTIKSGATLRVESGVEEAMVGNTLVVEDGATLYIAEGTTMRFCTVTVAGASLDAGFYTSSDGWITGGGKVISESPWPADKTAVWNRNDYSSSIAAGECEWYQGANLSGESLALTAGEGASAVIGSDGVTTANAGATYTWGWPTWIYGNQTWKVDKNDTLDIAASLFTLSPGSLTFFPGDNGAGKVKISADQPLSSRIVFSGPEMTLGGVTISSPVSIYSQSTILGDGKTNTFVGAISALNTTTSDKLGFKDGIFRFKGGVLSSQVRIGGKSEIIVEGAPWEMGTKDKDGVTVASASRFYPYCNMTFSVPSNTISIHNFAIAPDAGNVTIRTTVPYAIYRGSTGQQRISLGITLGHIDTWDQGHSNNVKWDLCGCDQEIVTFCCSSNNAVITSESPAQLHYLLNNDTQNARYNLVWYSTTNYVHFTGAAGLTYEGTCNSTVALVEDSPTSGRLEVLKGKVAIAKRAPHPASGFYWPGGSWTNASAVVVGGTGKLTLEHSRAIGKKTDVCIDGTSATLELAEGVMQRCRELYIDGSKQDHGTWGGPDSVAEHKSNRLAGSGVLRVYGENGPGITIIFR